MGLRPPHLKLKTGRNVAEIIRDRKSGLPKVRFKTLAGSSAIALGTFGRYAVQDSQIIDGERHQTEP